MVLSEPALGALLALGAAFTWAATSLLVRTLTPPFTTVGLNAARTLAGGAVLWVWVLRGGGAGDVAAIAAADLVLLAGSIVLAVAIGDTAFFDSTRRLGLGRGMTIAMTYPLVAAALATALLGEPLTWQLGAGTVLTLAGLFVLIRGRGDEEAAQPGWGVGVAGAVVASLAWGISSVLLKAPLQGVDPVTAQAIRLPIAGALLAATPWAGGLALALRGASVGTLARLAALGGLTAVSSVMFVAGLKYAGVAVATVLSATAPLFAIALGLAFLGERVTRPVAAGAAIAVAGIVVLQL
ncbi:MAG: DMT family transporter [Candidatus Rokubacteria bacterium]|nr:DMT family transporter [Candidatus Rokubacteria bacterium]